MKMNSQELNYTDIKSFGLLHNSHTEKVHLVTGNLFQL